jgi:hypothetical protein
MSPWGPMTFPGVGGQGQEGALQFFDRRFEPRGIVAKAGSQMRRFHRARALRRSPSGISRGRVPPRCARHLCRHPDPRGWSWPPMMAAARGRSFSSASVACVMELSCNASKRLRQWVARGGASVFHVIGEAAENHFQQTLGNISARYFRTFERCRATRPAFFTGHFGRRHRLAGGYGWTATKASASGKSATRYWPQRRNGRRYKGRPSGTRLRVRSLPHKQGKAHGKGRSTRAGR